MSVATTDIVAALQQQGYEPTPNGNDYRSKCPCHDGDNPNVLAISADGKMYCHKCEANTGNVLKAIGLAEVRPQHGRKPKVTIAGYKDPVTLHDSEQSAIDGVTWSVFQKLGSEQRPPDRVHRYHEGDGNHIGTVLLWKFENGDKETRQIRRHEGGWISKGMVAPRPLYRLPDIIDAAEVWICEGEKACDAAGSLGLQATTSAGGSNAARKSDWQPLDGKRVYILPDNDTPGEKFARTVVELIRKQAPNATIEVKRLKDDWPEIPDGGDVYDWQEHFDAADIETLRTRLHAIPDSSAESVYALALKPEGNGASVDKKKSVNVKAQDYTPFPVETLPDVLRVFCTEVSAAVGCDLAFVALPVLAVCAAAIGRSRQLRIKSGWFVPSLLWTLIVGESGTQKSPPVRMATKPVKDLQSEQAESYLRELAAYLDESAAYKTAIKRWNTTQEGDKPVEPVQPSRPRCLVQDSTIEALAPILKDNERGVLMARDELAGWLASFDRYASGKGKSSGDVPKWLEIYNCESIVIDRKTGDSPFLFVKSPSVSICGGIQPDILASCMTDEHKSSGLESRILMAYPPRRPKQWHDEELSDPTMKAYSDCITELFSLGMTSDVSGNLIPATLKLSPGALNLFKNFVNTNGAEQQALHGHLASQWSKLEEIPARLAIALHCVHQVTTGVDDAFVVGERTMRESIELTEWFKTEVLRIKSALSEPEEIREARHLIDWIRDHGGRITARALRQNRRDIESTEQADLKLMHLVSIGAGDWQGIHASREFVLHD